MLKVFIDADACPVKEDAYRVSKRYELQVTVVCNRSIVVPRADWIHLQVTENRFDAVDDWIATNAEKDDIVITNDILLAERCLKNKARVLDPRGRLFTEDNIGEALATRELLSELRQRGEIGLGPQKMGKKHHSGFLATFDQLINQVLKANGLTRSPKKS